jgi:hypothetical protein
MENHTEDSAGEVTVDSGIYPSAGDGKLEQYPGLDSAKTVSQGMKNIRSFVNKNPDICHKITVFSFTSQCLEQLGHAV